MQIVRLRLLGFKSFVEPAELIIERGLTGVVGPNGCGKSNLLEALRWVMGEASHKSMRAAAMDDVIFAGTSTRPQREAAEVTMFIDNTARGAPAEFNHHDAIEITRRIEREAGSAYRINGREARARDVKILFEDAATGARSPALVRQGQIGEIVNARPDQRRRILEDAAGIAGLHSRRHEAELRLRAAEGNLQRLNDVLGQLTSQAEALKRQARAARRYKDVSAEIRKSEALVLHLSWAEAQALVASEEGALDAALSAVALTNGAEAEAIEKEAVAGASLPALREAETRAGAALARVDVEREELDREAARAEERQRELLTRMTQLEADIARETKFLAEADGDLAQLEKEERELIRLGEGEGAAVAGAAETMARRDTSLVATERQLATVTTEAAENRARRRSLEDALAERRETVARLERRLAEIAALAEEIAARAPDGALLAANAANVEQLARELTRAEGATAAAERSARELAAVAASWREASAKARLRQQTLGAEREAITRLLTRLDSAGQAAIVDQLAVVPGYETALGAALGEDLDAPLADTASIHWSGLAGADERTPLPGGVTGLDAYVEGPPEIARRLRQIGVVSVEDGARLQAALRQGQRLVSREGDLWRWDGFVARAGGHNAAAQRLALRNRLAVIEAEAATASAEADTLAAAERESADALAVAVAAEQNERRAWRDANGGIATAQDALARIERETREHEARLAGATEARASATAELGAARERLASADATRASLLDEPDPEPRLAAAQSEAIAERSAMAQARSRLAALEDERERRSARLTALETERERLEARQASAREQTHVLTARLAETKQEFDVTRQRPAEIGVRRLRLQDALDQAARERQGAADALAAGEASHRVAAQALREKQAALAEAREDKVRVEVRLDGARTRRQDEARRIREALSVAPDACLALAELAPGAPVPSLADADRWLAKLRGDRERLGGVNLTADEELAKVSGEVSGLDQERADVEEAVAKLRAGIGQLNREGKTRLDEAFSVVDAHFQRLFTTLFNGGEARLEMIDAEDPLEGGLEIIAKPPGKKPATLSLLSGGEQTLTALALIFAVFLTNPSPICVLDEVDAPLDDSNVDRFCTLMEKMAAETQTRFLVITHHPMTMTRMNRLFGVTMQERGVSQLVSVDLEEAQLYREAG